MLAWTLTRPDSHIRAMLAGVAESEITSSLFAVSLMSAGGSSGFASVTGSALEVPGDLIRLSVGIEDCDDLLDDLRQAL